MNTPQILKVENLKVVFDSAKGYITAVKDVNFALRKGEILALVGESGSGKSVTMKAAMGILDKNSVVNSGTIIYTYNHTEDEKKTVDLLKLSKKEMRKHINGKRIAMISGVVDSIPMTKRFAGYQRALEAETRAGEAQQVPKRA